MGHSSIHTLRRRKVFTSIWYFMTVTYVSAQFHSRAAGNIHHIVGPKISSPPQDLAACNFQAISTTITPPPRAPKPSFHSLAEETLTRGHSAHHCPLGSVFYSHARGVRVSPYFLPHSARKTKSSSFSTSPCDGSTNGLFGIVFGIVFGTECFLFSFRAAACSRTSSAGPPC